MTQSQRIRTTLGPNLITLLANLIRREPDSVDTWFQDMQTAKFRSSSLAPVIEWTEFADFGHPTPSSMIANATPSTSASEAIAGLDQFTSVSNTLQAFATSFDAFPFPSASVNEVSSFNSDIDLQSPPVVSTWPVAPYLHSAEFSEQYISDKDILAPFKDLEPDLNITELLTKPPIHDPEYPAPYALTVDCPFDM
ncbi:MAG: hypothetical protein Q9159_003563 [Coniocarpon cinnabarinum]